jgi:hypothetical protein
MSNGVASQTVPIRNIGKSVAALAVGFVANLALSLATDIGLHVMGIMPALDQPWSNAQLLGATTYRALYGVFSSYLVARLAPRRPLEHALIGGAIGMVLGTAGAAATWTRGLGPHWYPVALVVLALPTAWVGGKVRTAQMR